MHGKAKKGEREAEKAERSRIEYSVHGTDRRPGRWSSSSSLATPAIYPHPLLNLAQEIQAFFIRHPSQPGLLAGLAWIPCKTRVFLFHGVGVMR